MAYDKTLYFIDNVPMILEIYLIFIAILLIIKIIELCYKKFTKRMDMCARTFLAILRILTSPGLFWRLTDFGYTTFTLFIAVDYLFMWPSNSTPGEISALNYNRFLRFMTLFIVAIGYPSYVHLLIYFHWNDPMLMEKYPVLFDALRLSFSSKCLPMIYIWRKIC
jgi:hypothetical protein